MVKTGRKEKSRRSLKILKQIEELQRAVAFKEKELQKLETIMEARKKLHSRTEDIDDACHAVDERTTANKTKDIQNVETAKKNYCKVTAAVQGDCVAAVQGDCVAAVQGDCVAAVQNDLGLNSHHHIKCESNNMLEACFDDGMTSVFENFGTGNFMEENVDDELNLKPECSSSIKKLDVPLTVSGEFNCYEQESQICISQFLNGASLKRQYSGIVGDMQIKRRTSVNNASPNCNVNNISSLKSKTKVGKDSKTVSKVSYCNGVEENECLIKQEVLSQETIDNFKNFNNDSFFGTEDDNKYFKTMGSSEEKKLETSDVKFNSQEDELFKTFSLEFVNIKKESEGDHPTADEDLRKDELKMHSVTLQVPKFVPLSDWVYKIDNEHDVSDEQISQSGMPKHAFGNDIIQSQKDASKQLLNNRNSEKNNISLIDSTDGNLRNGPPVDISALSPGSFVQLNRLKTKYKIYKSGKMLEENASVILQEQSVTSSMFDAEWNGAVINNNDMISTHHLTAFSQTSSKCSPSKDVITSEAVLKPNGIVNTADVGEFSQNVIRTRKLSDNACPIIGKDGDVDSNKESGKAVDNNGPEVLKDQQSITASAFEAKWDDVTNKDNDSITASYLDDILLPLFESSASKNVDESVSQSYTKQNDIEVEAMDKQHKGKAKQSAKNVYNVPAKDENADLSDDESQAERDCACRVAWQKSFNCHQCAVNGITYRPCSASTSAVRSHTDEGGNKANSKLTDDAIRIEEEIGEMNIMSDDLDEDFSSWLSNLKDPCDDDHKPQVTQIGEENYFEGELNPASKTEYNKNVPESNMDRVKEIKSSKELSKTVPKSHTSLAQSTCDEQSNKEPTAYAKWLELSKAKSSPGMRDIVYLEDVEILEYLESKDRKVFGKSTCIDEIVPENVVDLTVAIFGGKYFIILFLICEILVYRYHEEQWFKSRQWSVEGQGVRIYKGFHIQDEDTFIVGIVYLTLTQCLDNVFFQMKDTDYLYSLDVKCQPLSSTFFQDLYICHMHGLTFLSSVIDGKTNAFLNSFIDVSAKPSIISTCIDLLLSPLTSVCHVNILPYFFTCKDGHLTLYKHENDTNYKLKDTKFHSLPSSSKLQHAVMDIDGNCVLLVTGFGVSKNDFCKLVLLSLHKENVYHTINYKLDEGGEDKNPQENCDIKVLVDKNYVIILEGACIKIYDFWSGNSHGVLDCGDNVALIANSHRLLVMCYHKGCLRTIFLNDPVSAKTM